MLTIDTLTAAGIAPRVAQVFAEPLARACARFGIDTPARVAAFVAQCAHDSRGFVLLEEGLLCRTPELICAMWPAKVPSLAEAERLAGAPQALANRVYSHCDGNGDADSGDGWRYRGRGLIRLRGRGPYRAAGAALDQPLEAQPELVARPVQACWTAAWLWHSQGLNALADRREIEAIARALQAPGLALQERRALYRGALAALQAEPD